MGCLSRLSLSLPFYDKFKYSFYSQQTSRLDRLFVRGDTGNSRAGAFLFLSRPHLHTHHPGLSYLPRWWFVLLSVIPLCRVDFACFNSLIHMFQFEGSILLSSVTLASFFLFTLLFFFNSFHFFCNIHLFKHMKFSCGNISLSVCLPVCLAAPSITLCLCLISA